MLGNRSIYKSKPNRILKNASIKAQIETSNGIDPNLWLLHAIENRLFFHNHWDNLHNCTVLSMIGSFSIVAMKWDGPTNIYIEGQEFVTTWKPFPQRKYFFLLKTGAWENFCGTWGPFGGKFFFWMPAPRSTKYKKKFTTTCVFEIKL